jgi:SAM-dependent methyltransferase
MPYDPAFFKGCAPHYVQGRPPYASGLSSLLAKAVPLDGSGRLLDVGTGPGILAVTLAPLVKSVVAIDPDPDMLAQGQDRGKAAGVDNIQWVCCRAEDLGQHVSGPFRLATCGLSFHWMERERVAEIVHDLLEPRGALALISHVAEGRPVPEGPAYPPVPHEAIRAVVERFLGPGRRAGLGFRTLPPDSFEEALARTRFGPPERLLAPGRPDLVQNIDGVISNYLSRSFCAPHLFGDRLPEFVSTLQQELQTLSPPGLFWNWPGDTEILLARRRE